MRFRTQLILVFILGSIFSFILTPLMFEDLNDVADNKIKRINAMISTLAERFANNLTLDTFPIEVDGHLFPGYTKQSTEVFRNQHVILHGDSMTRFMLMKALHPILNYLTEPDAPFAYYPETGHNFWSVPDIGQKGGDWWGSVYHPYWGNDYSTSPLIQKLNFTLNSERPWPYPVEESQCELYDYIDSIEERKSSITVFMFSITAHFLYRSFLDGNSKLEPCSPHMFLKFTDWVDYILNKTEGIPIRIFQPMTRICSHSEQLTKYDEFRAWVENGTETLATKQCVNESKSVEYCKSGYWSHENVEAANKRVIDYLEHRVYISPVHVLSSNASEYCPTDDEIHSEKTDALRARMLVEILNLHRNFSHAS